MVLEATLVVEYCRKDKGEGEGFHFFLAGGAILQTRPFPQELDQLVLLATKPFSTSENFSKV